MSDFLSVEEELRKRGDDVESDSLEVSFSKLVDHSPDLN